MKTGPGRSGGRPPPLPQIRACPIKAPGSSRHGFASRHAIGWLSGYSGSRLRVLGLVPTNSSAARHPLPFPGSARLAFPCFAGTMRCSDSLPPSRLTCLRSAIPRVAPVLSLSQPRAPDCEPGVGKPVAPVPARSAWRGPGPPRFPGNPMDLRRVLRPRPSRTPLALTVCRCCPRADKNEGPSG